MPFKYQIICLSISIGYPIHLMNFIISWRALCFTKLVTWIYLGIDWFGIWHVKLIQYIFNILTREKPSMCFLWSCMILTPKTKSASPKSFVSKSSDTTVGRRSLWKLQIEWHEPVRKRSTRRMRLCIRQEAIWDLLEIYPTQSFPIVHKLKDGCLMNELMGGLGLKDKFLPLMVSSMVSKNSFPRHITI